MFTHTIIHTNTIKIYNCANSIIYNQHITRNLHNTGNGHRLKYLCKMKIYVVNTQDLEYGFAFSYSS